MNKKVKTPKMMTSMHNNAGSLHQQTNIGYLDGRVEVMPQSSMVGNSAGLFRPNLISCSTYQLNSNKNAVKKDFDDDPLGRNAVYSLASGGEKDVLHSPLSNFSEISKDHGYRSATQERTVSAGSITRSSPIVESRIRQFGSSNSPVSTFIPSLGGAMPFVGTVPAVDIASLCSIPGFGVPKRAKLLTSHVPEYVLEGIGNYNNSGNNRNNSPSMNSFSMIGNLVGTNGNGSNCVRDGLSCQKNSSEVRRESAYRPQVEAISPTASGDEMSQDDVIRQSRDDIIQSIEKLERCVNTVDQKLVKLRKYKEQLEETAKHPPEGRVDQPLPVVDLSKLGIAHTIYSENRVKASKSHDFMKTSEFLPSLPLYQNPSDAQIYHDNIKKFASFKPSLTLYIKKRKQFDLKRMSILCQRYDKLSESWVQRMDKIENNPKKRMKDAKTREVFEKVFPELKKKREDREKLLKAVKKSDDPALDPEEEDLRVRTSLVAQPPILLDALVKKRSFCNENGRIPDSCSMSRLQPGVKKYYWTRAEAVVFRDTYVTNPKNFALISSYLQNKSIQDCISFYYMSKKQEGYKQLVRKHNMSRRKHDKAKKAQINKEVKEEKVEEFSDVKDIKFLPSSPLSGRSASTSLFPYSFKLPDYLLLPAEDPAKATVLPEARPQTPPSPELPVPASSGISAVKTEPASLQPSQSQAVAVSVKQEFDTSLDLSSTSCAQLSSNFVTVVSAPMSSSSPTVLQSPSPQSTVTSFSSNPSVVSTVATAPLLSSVSHSSLLTPARLKSPNYMPATPATPAAPTESVAAASATQQTITPHSSMSHHYAGGGSIVQGTPVVSNHHESPSSAARQQLAHHQLFMQQQHEQLLLQHMSLNNPDLRAFLNQLAVSQQAQEMRGSIIKGTPNHTISREASGNSHFKNDPTALLAGRVGKQERNSSPSTNHNSPKRASSSSKQKTSVKNENRSDSGQSLCSANSGEENNRTLDNSRDVLFDDYLTAQKMNSSVVLQQRKVSAAATTMNVTSPSSAVVSIASSSSNDQQQQQQLSMKKQSNPHLKRKNVPTQPLGQPSMGGDGMIYFGGAEIPKGVFSGPMQALDGNELAKRFLDSIISQGAIQNNSGGLGGHVPPPPLKNNTFDSMRPGTPSSGSPKVSNRANPNFQPPVSTLPSSTMLRPLVSQFPPLPNLSLLQGQFPYILPTFAPQPTSSSSSSSSASVDKALTNMKDRMNFIPPSISTHHTAATTSRNAAVAVPYSGCGSSVNNNHGRNASGGSSSSSSSNTGHSSSNNNKAGARTCEAQQFTAVSNNIYGINSNIYNFISMSHNASQQPPSSAPLHYPQLPQLHVPPPPTQQQQQAPSSTFGTPPPPSPGSFLSFQLGQFMPPLSTLVSSTSLSTSSRAIVTQLLLQNQQQQHLSCSGSISMPAPASAAAKTNAVVSSHS